MNVPNSQVHVHMCVVIPGVAISVTVHLDRSYLQTENPALVGLQFGSLHVFCYANFADECLCLCLFVNLHILYCVFSMLLCLLWTTSLCSWPLCSDMASYWYLCYFTAVSVLSWHYEPLCSFVASLHYSSSMSNALRQYMKNYVFFWLWLVI